MGIAGSLIATTHLPGAQHDGFMLAAGLLMLGNLPACLGYVSMIVLMLHSRSPFSKVRVLAPFGRMALTNYLCQSLVMSSVFFGYGLGYWGLGRAWQLVFALALCGGADRLQPLVAGPLPLRPCRMAVARDHLHEDSGDADRAGSRRHARAAEPLTEASASRNLQPAFLPQQNVVLAQAGIHAAAWFDARSIQSG